MTGEPNHNALKTGYKLHWYEIESVLGEGGFGITYLARDTNLDRPVAIKEYLPSDFAVRTADNSVSPTSGNTKAQYEWFLERFIKEAKVLSKFEHPNIVRVFAVFEENNTGYLIMPYEEGESLRSLLKRKKTLDELTLLNIIAPILDGLELVHEHDFIHRDIKPDNIFIRKDGSPVLLDFGSARQSVTGQVNTLTSLFSPGYAPFEQYYSKSDEQGPWTDIYGLGATLYRAIAGRPPLDAVERSKSVLEGTEDAFISASEIGIGHYSEKFLKAIDHALSFKFQDRPQTIDDWRKEFDFNPIFTNASEIDGEMTTELKRQTNVAEKKKNNSRKLIAATLSCIAIVMAIFLFIKIEKNKTIEPVQKIVPAQTTGNIHSNNELSTWEDNETLQIDKSESIEKQILDKQHELDEVLEKERKLLEEERKLIEEERVRLEEIRKLEMEEKQLLIEKEKRLEERSKN